MGVLISPVHDFKVQRFVEMGFSFEAIDTNEGNKRVGVFLCAPCKIGVKSSLDVELERMDRDENMGKIMELVDYAKEQSLPILRTKYNTEGYLHGFLVNVLKEYTSQGIAEMVGRAVNRMAMEMNIRIVLGIATSVYSAKSSLKAGSEVFYSLRYDEYHLKPPHDAVRVVATDLAQFKSKL